MVMAMVGQSRAHALQDVYAWAFSELCGQKAVLVALMQALRIASRQEPVRKYFN